MPEIYISIGEIVINSGVTDYVLFLLIAILLQSIKTKK
jgi:hypothetical protein